MFERNNLNVMIFAPHVDDEVLGCAGVILKNRNKIARLTVIHITGTDERYQEFEVVSKYLSVDSHISLRFRDGFIQNDATNITVELIKYIQDIKPNIVFMPHVGDQHTDHQALYHIGLDAIQKARYWDIGKDGHRVDDIYLYEVWSFMQTISHIVDITDVFEEKRQLLSYYQSQMSFPYLEYSNIVNSYRGLIHNRTGQAEAFGHLCI